MRAVRSLTALLLLSAGVVHVNAESAPGDEEISTTTNTKSLADFTRSETLQLLQFWRLDVLAPSFEQFSLSGATLSAMHDEDFEPRMFPGVFPGHVRHLKRLVDDAKVHGIPSNFADDLPVANDGASSVQDSVGHGRDAVSYTHLTLPTIYSV